jgi:G-patch domain
MLPSTRFLLFYHHPDSYHLQDAQAAMSKFNSLDKFTIASKPVLVSYIHAGVFVPVTKPTDDLAYSFAASTNPAIRLAYWDQKAYLRELVVSDDVPASSPAEETQEAETKGRKRKAESANLLPSKKSAPSLLQVWTNKQAELHGGKKKAQAHGTNEEKPKDSEKPPAEADRSYADMKKKCCYLCARQFKTEAEVNKHERMSDLHRENLRNDELKAKAMTKLAKAGLLEEGSEYRDRARERRKAFGQPSKPKPGAGKAGPEAKSKSEAGGGGGDEEAARGPSKGASLLGKMGWSAGQGLGAQGTGVTAPIATEAYAQGVGLGAEGGRLGDAADEAQRRTKGGYEAFLEKTREQARGRYENMK